ncbi:MAG: tRNA (uridine(34)/cytosine(34)/5-carboxymethylaminomethyluridine(34)-2'-O)-methyltransferase TrmL [Peptococcaceae bacterium]|nr:tRNA (uridine(34)/cytosine(34)/5-carboxymethylaminomethyluridine(34)-2'-O)-methyltransferase TrmL [Peptococcaceae bacterium]
MRVVLVEPEIPANTGNIARTCAVTGAELHLVRPLGFSIDDRHLKRAGLDYWHLVKVYLHDSFRSLLEDYPEGRFFYFSTRGRRLYTEFRYRQDDFLVFGKETAGLPDHILEGNEEYTLRIPMLPGLRSINLSNSVAVVVFEALRQRGFPGMA